MSGIRWSSEQVEQYLAGFTGDRGAAVRVTDGKSDLKSGAAPANNAEKIYPRYRITINHRGRRIADATGRSHKAAVDGLVRGGLLPDDGPAWLEEITEKSERADINETIIEIWQEW